MHEFELIKKFFTIQPVHRQDVILGSGDDCAIVQPAVNEEWLITTDTLVEGAHFLKNTQPFDIGFKALAVNLSDIAAMGGTPAWYTVALTLPCVDESWIKQWSEGLFAVAKQYQVQLIGGNLSKGPLTITIQMLGHIPKNNALRRSGAKPGDFIYVTHTLGDAALALLFLQNKIAIESQYQNEILTRLHRPEPRIAIGQQLRQIASAAIDISDGLAADLQHILEDSHVGATIYIDQLPLSNALRHSVSEEQAFQLALNGGDDYELCFTMSPDKPVIPNCTCIGVINNHKKLDIRFTRGEKYEGMVQGFQHF